ncbi:MAG: hypothetical protein GX760_04050 [Erysipelothrix sp.]|nr:hypothetical protein [Erysipelothrix sp.]
MNIIFVYIIISVLFSIYGSVKAEKDKQRKSQMQPKSFKEIIQEKINELNLDDERKEYVLEAKQEYLDEINDPYANRNHEHENMEHMEAMPTRDQRILKQQLTEIKNYDGYQVPYEVEYPKVEETVEIKPENDPSIVDKVMADIDDNVVKAFILSEIFSKPKSLQ